MFRILVMNGLLISLIFIWTSAAKEPSTKTLIKSSPELPRGPLDYSQNVQKETNNDIRSTKNLCKLDHGGVCVKKKKSCPSHLPSEKSPGKPYCSKRHRCCYPDLTTPAPTVLAPTTPISEDVSWTDIRNACIKGHNFAIYEPVENIDICKEKCVEEAGVSCQSIEFSSVEQMCSISEARSDYDEYAEPCFLDGWVFAEIELNTVPTTVVPSSSMVPNNSTTKGPITDVPPTPMVPNNNNTNDPTTDAPPTSMVPNNNKTNDVSCNLAWNHEEDRPLIMIRETRDIIPLISADITDDPNRIPEAIKLTFACPGESNVFQHIDGVHTKLHGECVSSNRFKVCVNNYPEIMDLSQLSCSSQIQPSIIKQDIDTSYKKTCEDIGGELFKMGYIYGDYREFKDLEAKLCFRDEDQKIVWTSTNVNRMVSSPSMRYKVPDNFRSAQGIPMNTLFSQTLQQETLKQGLDKEVTSIWNDKACRNHGGHCVIGGTSCPVHLPHQTSQGEPLCNIFHRCCYSDPCEPTTCTYNSQTGRCSLGPLAGTTGVGSQECKEGCQCYIKDNKRLTQIKRYQDRKELSKLRGGDTVCGTVIQDDDDCVLVWMNEKTNNLPLIVDDLNDAILPTGEKENKKIRIANDKTVFFACPGVENGFKEKTSPIIRATCEEGKLLDGELKEIQLADLGCKNMIESSTIRFLETKENGKEEQKKCDKGRSKMWQIVFEIDPVKHWIYPLIGVCFHEANNGKQTVVYTVNMIYGPSIKGKYNKKKEDPNSKIRFHNPKDTFSYRKMDNIYNPSSQFTYFEKKLDLPDVIKKEEGKKTEYFSRGHLATAGGFITRAEQHASYNYINVLPQWKTFNELNWGYLEIDIQMEASKRGIALKIITGGFGSQLQMEGVQISLGDPDSKKSVLDVPSVIHKVVIFPEEQNEEIINFMLINDPRAMKVCPDKEKSMCPDVKWLHPNAEKNYKIPSMGCIYCFKLKKPPL